MNALLSHSPLAGFAGHIAQAAAQLIDQPARRRALALFALATLGAANAGAAGLQVAPVSVALAQAERAAVVTLSNTGTSPMNVQVRAYKWSQTEQDEYVLDPTNDLIVSPPIMQLAPGAQQELRLIRTQPSSAQEQQYRIIVDELPSPTVALKKGINLMLRHNIPVFLNAEQNPSAQLQWRGEAVAGGKTRIRISNTGQTRAQIARIWLAKEGKELENGIEEGGTQSFEQTQKIHMNPPRNHELCQYFNIDQNKIVSSQQKSIRKIKRKA